MSRRSPLFLSLVLILGLPGAAAVAQPPAYTVQLLGPLVTDIGDFPNVSALRLNDRGDAVGQVHVQLEDRAAGAAFRYTAAGGMENIDPFGNFNSIGWRINNSGLAYGSDFGNRGQSSIYVYDDSGFQFIAEDMDSAFMSGLQVNAMNDNGDLLGTTGVFSRGRVQPYLYTAAGGWVEFSGIDPRLGNHALGVLLNNSGDMVFILDDFPARPALLLTAEGDLFDLGGPDDYFEPLAMNESAQVVGYTEDAAGRTVGFLFTPGEGMTVIRKKGFKTARALHVTADGTVAGALTKRKYSDAHGALFVRRPSGRMKVVVKRRQFKRLAAEAGFAMGGVAVQAVNDRLEFVGYIFGPSSDDPFEAIPTLPFVYSRKLGVRNLQAEFDAAGIDGVSGEAWEINAAGQILAGVRLEDRGTTAILTPVD